MCVNEREAGKVVSMQGAEEMIFYMAWRLVGQDQEAHVKRMYRIKNEHIRGTARVRCREDRTKEAKLR